MVTAASYDTVVWTRPWLDHMTALSGLNMVWSCSKETINAVCSYRQQMW